MKKLLLSFLMTLLVFPAMAKEVSEELVPANLNGSNTAYNATREYTSTTSGFSYKLGAYINGTNFQQNKSKGCFFNVTANSKNYKIVKVELVGNTLNSTYFNAKKSSSAMTVSVTKAGSGTATISGGSNASVANNAFVVNDYFFAYAVNTSASSFTFSKIRVTYDDGTSDKLPATLSWEMAEVSGSNLSMTVGDIVELKAVAKASGTVITDGTISYALTSGSSSVELADEVLSAEAAGNAVITATLTSDTYEATPLTLNVSVSAEPQYTKPVAKVGDTEIAQNGTIHVGDMITLSTSPADGAIAYTFTVDGVKILDDIYSEAFTASKAGAANIQAFAAGDYGKDSETLNLNFTIAKKDTKITYSAEEASVYLNDAKDFNAPTLTVEPAGLSVAYTSSVQTVATIDANGKLNIVGAGTTVIKAAFAGDDTYNSSEDSYTLTVLPGSAPQEIIDELVYTDFKTGSDGASGTTPSGGNSNYGTYYFKSAKTGILYQAQMSTANNAITLRSKNSNSGIITMTNPNGYVLQSVEATWSTATTADRTLDVYGKDAAYSAPTDLYGNGAATKGTKIGSINNKAADKTLTVEDLIYPFMGIRSNSGAQSMTKIILKWTKATPMTEIALAWKDFSDGETMTIEIGDTKSISFTATTKDGSALSDEVGFNHTFEYTPADPQALTVDLTNFQVTGAAVGTCKVTLDLDEQTKALNKYLATPITVTFNVIEPEGDFPAVKFLKNGTVLEGTQHTVQEGTQVEMTCEGASYIYYTLDDSENEFYADVRDGKKAYLIISNDCKVTAYGKGLPDEDLTGKITTTHFAVTTEGHETTATFDFHQNVYGHEVHTDSADRTYDPENSLYKEQDVTLTTIGDTRMWQATAGTEFRAYTAGGFTMSVPAGGKILSIKLTRGTRGSMNEWTIDGEPTGVSGATDEYTWKGSAQTVTVLNTKSSDNPLAKIDVVYTLTDLVLPIAYLNDETDALIHGQSYKLETATTDVRIEHEKPEAVIYYYVESFGHSDNLGTTPAAAPAHAEAQAADETLERNGVTYTKLPESGKVKINGSSRIHYFAQYDGRNTSIQNHTFAVPTGIENVEIEGVDSEAVYYNLQGVRVANPEKGIFIRIQNGKATKIMK